MLAYVGSKHRYKKYIIPLLNGLGNTLVEPFVGGCNIIPYTKHKYKFAYDSNEYLIAMYQELQKGWIPPEQVTEDFYYSVRDYKDQYEPYLVGWIGFTASFRAKFFSGYCGHYRNGRSRYTENLVRIKRLVPLLKDISFKCLPYTQAEYPQDSVVYLDPPYIQNYYSSDFNEYLFFKFYRKLDNPIILSYPVIDIEGFSLIRSYNSAENISGNLINIRKPDRVEGVYSNVPIPYHLRLQIGAS